MFFGLLAQGLCGQADAPSLDRQKADQTGPRDFNSPHFLLHTDIDADEARELLKRLETMIGLVSRYWGRPSRGIIECYVVRDLQQWPPGSLHGDGLAYIRKRGGVCRSQRQSRGKHRQKKATVYAFAGNGIPQHESVHAYCWQTFGRYGPVWYREGMAELGQYWKEGEKAVNIEPHTLRYLQESPPLAIGEMISQERHTGNWKDYAWRWALCHLLEKNPNYSSQFRPLGLGLLLGKPVSFEQVFGPVARNIEFEYLFFLKHMDNGYRVDLCAWDWEAKFRPLRNSSRAIKTTVRAERGWQPSGMTVLSGIEYEYVSTGRWKTENVSGVKSLDSKSLDADGGEDGTGRLMGVVMQDFKLGKPFKLGTHGSFTLPSGGDLYLRCKDRWNELADNSGQIKFKVKVKGKGSPLRKPAD